jgi:hypothetical protein
VNGQLSVDLLLAGPVSELGLVVGGVLRLHPLDHQTVVAIAFLLDNLTFLKNYLCTYSENLF